MRRSGRVGNALPGNGAGEPTESKAGLGTKGSQGQAEPKWSFSEDQRFPTPSFGEEQNELEEPQEHLRAPEIKEDRRSFPAGERVHVAVGNLPDRATTATREDQGHRPDVKELEHDGGVEEPPTFRQHGVL